LDGCLWWTGKLDKDGYGKLYVSEFRQQGLQPVISTYRYAWYLTHGELPSETLDHVCHDPAVCAGGSACTHRRCDDPEHLREASWAQNMRRSVRNLNREQGLCYKGLHAMTPANTVTAGGKERCLTCYATYQIKYWQKKLDALLPRG
jgi:hypothetical protein